MTKDLTSIYKKHRGRWVALSSDLQKVISSGNSAMSVYKKVRKNSKITPTILKVPSNLNAYIG